MHASKKSSLTYFENGNSEKLTTYKESLKERDRDYSTLFPLPSRKRLPSAHVIVGLSHLAATLLLFSYKIHQVARISRNFHF